MGIFKKAARGTKRAFGYGEVKDNSSYIAKVTREFITLSGSGRAYNSFDELPYTEQQLSGFYNNFKKLALTYSVIVILGMLYVLYNLVHGLNITALLAFCFSLACLSMAFRYHFWMMQLTKRKLGCNLIDYCRYLFGKEEK